MTDIQTDRQTEAPGKTICLPTLKGGGGGKNFKKILYSFTFFTFTNSVDPDEILLYLKIFFTFTNSIDPDVMQHYAAFHLGLHCLQKYLFRDFLNTKS